MKPAADDRRIARLIQMTAAEFQPLFDRSKSSDIALGSLTPHNSSSAAKIVAAIALARREGWLHRLVTQIVMECSSVQASDAVLAEAARQKLLKSGSILEALADPARGFAGRGADYRRLSQILRRICRIDVDGEPRGTGILLRSDLVMTSWQVVRTLTDLVPTSHRPRLEMKPGSASRIRLLFDDADLFRNDDRLLRGLSVAVADDWLLGSSLPHPLEPEGLPPQLRDTAGFVLIGLSGHVHVGVPPLAIQASGTPQAKDPLWIIRHRADGLSIDRAEASEVDGSWRFDHSLNQTDGFPGAPCFNQQFELVGMNQGDSGSNHFVPAFHFHSLIERLPPPSNRLVPMMCLTEGRPGHPVIGRMETQNWVWRQLERQDKPILLLNGHRGEGKSFTVEILRSLLPLAAHDVIWLDAIADVQSLAPRQFAARMLELAGYAPMQPVADDGNGTMTRWLLDNLLPAFLNALEAGRKMSGGAPKDLWIAIDNIERAAIGASTEASDFLYAFYAATRSRPWLRLILLGFDAPLPEHLTDLAEHHDLVPVSDEEIMASLSASFASSRGVVEQPMIDSAFELVTEGIRDIPRSKRLTVLQERLALISRIWSEGAAG